jgi:hypothetical protein
VGVHRRGTIDPVDCRASEPITDAIYLPCPLRRIAVMLNDVSAFLADHGQDFILAASGGIISV